MAYCVKCGSLVPDGTAFCSKCGTRVDSAPVNPAPAQSAGSQTAAQALNIINSALAVSEKIKPYLDESARAQEEEKRYRSKPSAVGTFFLVLAGIGLTAFGVFAAVVGLLYGAVGEFLLGLACALVGPFLLLCVQKKRFYYFKVPISVQALILLISAGLLVLAFLGAIFDGSILEFLLFALGAAAFFAHWLYYKKVQEPALVQRRKSILTNCLQVKENCAYQVEQIYANCSIRGLYPQNYLYDEAILFCKQAVESMRADTVKEALNLYEDTVYKSKMESMQRSTLMYQQQAAASLKGIEQEAVHTRRAAQVSAAANVATAYNANRIRKDIEE